MSSAGMLELLSERLRQAWQRRVSTHYFFTYRNFMNGKQAAASSPDLLFLRARAMARSGELYMAQALYADAVKLEPTLAEAIESQGEVLDVKGHRALAVKKYQEARQVRAETRPGAPDRHFVLRQRGRFVAEIIAYDSVLTSLKKNTLPYLARGNAQLMAGRPELALADYDAALRLKRDIPEIIALKGEALSIMGRYLEALEAFDLALAGRADDAEALSGRAIARIALGRIAEANADWQRQFELLRDAPAARACVAMRLANYEMALPQLEGALLKEPADPYWRLYRLTAQRRLGASAVTAEASPPGKWPAPLLSFYAGNQNEDDVLKQADTADRRAEALFQAGVLVFDRDRTAAALHWREVVRIAAPSMIEHGAALNELSRLGS